MNQLRNVPRADISVNRNRVKKYGRDKTDIYLNNGVEFEIELTNPTQDTWLAKIWVNERPIGMGGLVVRPGQHIFLERYLEDNKKFKFDTYMVDDVDEVQEAIAKNGVVHVQFYQKIASLTYSWTYTAQPTYTKTYTNLHGVTKKSFVPKRGGTYGSTIGAPSATSTGISDDASVTAMNMLDVQATYCADSAIPEPEQVETGRVEKGSESDQEFVPAYENFNTYAAYTYTYKLMPVSARPYEAYNVRVYCDECGRRQRKTDKFCPGCGTRF